MPALGRKQALSEHFKASLKTKFPRDSRNRLVASDASESLQISEAVDHWELSPRTDSEAFLSWAREFCLRHKVTWIVPTRDAEMLQWARWNGEHFFEETSILVSDRALMESWHGKASAALWLDQVGLPHPGWFSPENDVQRLRGPIIAKPTYGSASQGIFIVRTDSERVSTLGSLVGDYGVQPLIQGPEFTINLYFDPVGECRAIIPHRRLETRKGEVSHGITLDDPDLLELGTRFAAATQARARGPINFQVIRDEVGGRLYITDINPRFGGGYPLTHKAGGTFTDWICREFLLGESIQDRSWKTGIEFHRT